MGNFDPMPTEGIRTPPPSTEYLRYGAPPFNGVFQSKVAVSGGNVLAVQTADPNVKTREIVLQNIGTAAITMKYDLGAASDCSNGEFVLKAGDANYDGKGGSVTIAGWLGKMSAACASSSLLSVTITQP